MNTDQSQNFEQFNGYEQAPAVYTMPEKFLPQTKTKSKKTGKGIIIFLYFLIGVVVIAAGGAVWYLFLRQEPVSTDQPSLNIPPVNIVAPTTTTTTENTPEPVEVRFVARDEFNNEFSSVTLKLSGADTALAQQIKVNSLLPVQMTGRASRAIGAIYSFSLTNGGNLTQPTTFVFAYTEPDDLTSKKENSLQLAEEISTGTWKYLAGSKLDIVGNTISIELNALPQDQVTILSNLEEEENFDFTTENDEQVVDDSNLATTPLTSTLDSDNDGLTDVEELLYQANPALPDTDGDGYLDGQEVIYGYSPVSANSLAGDNLVTAYENQDMGISLYYPSSWAVRVGTADLESVSFESQGDDFMQISIQDNLDNLSISDWYGLLVPNLDQTLLNKTSVNGYDAIFSADLANLYVAVGDKVYIMTYSAGLKTQVDYLTTFAMMRTSLKFLTNAN